METDNKEVRLFNQLSLRKRLLGLSMVLIVPFAALTFYLMYSLNQISDSYSAIVKNVTQVNSFNIVFKEGRSGPIQTRPRPESGSAVPLSF